MRVCYLNKCNTEIPKTHYFCCLHWESLKGQIKCALKCTKPYSRYWRDSLLAAERYLVFNENSLKKKYWVQVKKCLIQFHSLSTKEARNHIKEYQKQFPIHSNDPSIDLIYHFEPFRLACKITGNRLSVKDFVEEYSNILK